MADVKAVADNLARVRGFACGHVHQPQHSTVQIDLVRGGCVQVFTAKSVDAADGNARIMCDPEFMASTKDVLLKSKWFAEVCDWPAAKRSRWQSCQNS